MMKWLNVSKSLSIYKFSYLASSHIYDDLPVATLSTLTSRTLEMLWIHLKSIYTEEEIDVILKYINSSTESNWATLSIISNNRSFLIDHNLNTDQVHLNFRFVVAVVDASKIPKCQWKQSESLLLGSRTATLANNS